MIVSVQINNQNYKFDASKPFDISIPLDFHGDQPNAFGVEKATSKPCKAESLIGDTRLGGSCNFEQITFIPHCNGTHTECVGHVTNDRISIHNSLKECFIPSTLITIAPVNALETNENYPVNLSDKDYLITKKSLKAALENTDENFLQGLIARTMPNDEGKKSRLYMENQPPFLSTEAIEFISEKNINHLFVDVPSIDRAFDEGRLSNHRIFWNIKQGSFQKNEKSFVNKTITEMIFAPDFIKDGYYLVNLQITAFVADASPSRPILFSPLVEI